MSYKKYCDACGKEMGNDKKINIFSHDQKHEFQLEVRLSSPCGMGEFHICRPCAIAILTAQAECEGQ